MIQGIDIRLTSDIVKVLSYFSIFAASPLPGRKFSNKVNPCEFVNIYHHKVGTLSHYILCSETYVH